MKELDLKLLPDYLRSRRWFAGKDLAINDIRVLDHLRFPLASGEPGGPEFALVVLQVQFEMGSPQQYLLSIRIGADGQISEALDDDRCASELLRLIRESVQVQSVGGLVRGERMLNSQPYFDGLGLSGSVRRLTTEQSNTSIVYGEKGILKLMRKLEPGVNPELEIGRFLSPFSESEITPRLLGALHLEGPLNATLGILHQFILAEGDGWEYVLNVMRHSAADSDFVTRINHLGRTVGELHLRLASRPDEPNFAPEPIHQVDLQRWSSSIIGELGVTIAWASKLFPDLEKRRDSLVARAKVLASLAPTGQKIRIHGDLHLGQVLKAGDRWIIFDFEGEPSRSFSQRREKHSPLKDVAGMIRSFDYAASAVELEGANPGDLRLLSREAFLSGYFDAVEGSAFLPSREADLFALLGVLELEKMLYELRYELQHRPEWARIPAGALMNTKWE